MNYISFVLAVLGATLFLTLFAGIFTWLRHRARLTRWLLAAHYVGLAAWIGSIMAIIELSFGFDSGHVFTPGSMPFAVGQLAFAAPVVLLAAKFWFAQCFPEGRLPRSLLPYFTLPLTAAALLASLVPGALFTEFSVSASGSIDRETGPLALLYFAFLLVHLVWPLGTLGLKWARAENRLIRNQLALLTIGFGVTAGVGIAMNSILPIFFDMTRFNAFGPVGSLASVAAFAYAVTRYRFLDIRSGLHRALSLAATGVLVGGGALAGLLQVPAGNPYLLLFANAMLLIAAVTLTPRVLDLVSRLASLLVFGVLQTTHEQLAELGREIAARSFDASYSTSRALQGLQDILGLRSRFVPAHALAGFGNDLLASRETVATEALAAQSVLERDSQLGSVADALRREGIAALTPIWLPGRAEPIGALIAEEKENGGMLTAEDLFGLELLGSSAAAGFAQTAGGQAGSSQLSSCSELVNDASAASLAAADELDELLAAAPLANKKHRSRASQLLSIIRRETHQSQRALAHALLIEESSNPAIRQHLQSPAEIAAVLARVFEEKLLERLLWQLGHAGEPNIAVQYRHDPAASIRAEKETAAWLLSELLAIAIRHGGTQVELRSEQRGSAIIFQISTAGSLPADESELSLQALHALTEALRGSLAIRASRGRILAELALPLV